MMRTNPLRHNPGIMAMLALMGFGVIWMLWPGNPDLSEWSAASRAASRQPTGHPQLVSVESMPMMDGMACQWVPASAATTLTAALWQERLAEGSSTSAPAGTMHSRCAGATTPITRRRRPPLRCCSPIWLNGLAYRLKTHSACWTERLRSQPESRRNSKDWQTRSAMIPLQLR